MSQQDSVNLFTRQVSRIIEAMDSVGAFDFFDDEEHKQAVVGSIYQAAFAAALAGRVEGLYVLNTPEGSYERHVFQKTVTDVVESGAQQGAPNLDCHMENVRQFYEDLKGTTLYPGVSKLM